MDNIFDKSNDLIEKFVSKSENSRLKAGTGRYSTLFRGSLFGETETREVVKQLKEKPVKVVWLGSNPNVRSSLKQIKSNETSDYQHFLEQKNSGHFSEVRPDEGTGVLKPSWDPINKPDYRWRFYTEIFAELYGSERILMANFVPWGSKDFRSLLKEIKDLDEALLNRMLEFSVSLNQRVIEYLKPELVVVPKSIYQAPLKNWHFGVGEKKDIISRQIAAKVSFNFTVRETVVCNHKTKILTSPHPSYTSRVGKENRSYIQQEIIAALK